MARSTKAQKARHMNAARGLLQRGIALSEAVRRLASRVCSEQQREENTIASQTAALIDFAGSHDLVVQREWVFEDEGYSEATLERPGLERVRDLAAEGQVEVVLAYSPDRLSRKDAYQILLVWEFARHG